MTAETFLLNFFHELIEIFVHFALPLVLGIYFAGMVSELIPKEKLQAWLSPEGNLTWLKSIGLGLAFPGCSCSIIAYAETLKKANIHHSPIITFCIIGPQIGPAALFFSFYLLGPIFTFMRIGLALAIAACVIILVHKMRVRPCLKVKYEAPENEQDEVRNNNFWIRAYQTGFDDILPDMKKFILITIVATAVVTTFGLKDILQALGNNTYAMAVCFGIFIPLDVCAVDSVPLAAGFLSSGLGLSLVLIFIVAGPTSNLIMMEFVRKHFGTRILIVYLVGLFISAMVGAWYFSTVVQDGTAIIPMSTKSEDWIPFYFYNIAGIIMAYQFFIKPWLSKKGGL